MRVSEPTLYLDGRVSVFAGDCAAVIKTLADNSIDAAVTDPPYALVSITKRFGADGAAPAKAGKTGAYKRASAGFMGKRWDTGETAFSVEFWRDILRCLKPGAHLVAFGGTRSYHQLATAIENAGFEIRDQCKFDHESSAEMTAFLDSLNDEQYAQFRKLNETDELGQLAFCYGTGFPKSHSVSKGIDKAAGAEREVVGTQKLTGNGKTLSGNKASHDGDWSKGARSFDEIPITAPATDEARKWEGWGSSLKPAWEPICLARKPLSEPTIAANVLRWGCGALNIDACRVGTDAPRPGRSNAESRTGLTGVGGAVTYGAYAVRGSIAVEDTTLGRWPANLLLDDSQEVRDAFPETAASSASVGVKRYGRSGGIMGDVGALRDGRPEGHDDQGRLSRALFLFMQG